MKKYILSICCFVSITFSSCNYLDMVPEKDIETIESLFERRGNALQWWASLYGQYHSVIYAPQSDASWFGADEYIASDILYERKYDLGALHIAAGQQMSQEPYCPMWTKMYQIIRNCNIYLENIHRTYNFPEEEKKWSIADVKTLKAQIYFELLRHYGPIIMPDNAVPVNLPIEEYQLPRQPIDVCFAHIISLLDEAKENIPMYNDRTSGYGYTMCLEGLYAFKAKVLLYAASPLFNGNIFYSDFVNKDGVHLFNQNYDHDKWRLAAEAADEAVRICDEGGRKLYKHDGGKKSDLLNQMSNVEYSAYSNFDNEEFLIEARIRPSTYGLFLPRLENDDVHYYSQAVGCLSPSMKMVEMYYTSNGLPIANDNSWDYANRYKIGTESSHIYEDVISLNTEVVNLHLRREPRFYASIAGDRMYFQRGVNTLETSFNLLVKAHRGEEPWGTTQDIISNNSFQNITGYWLKKPLNSRFRTYAYLDQLLGTETFAVMRLAELYLIQSEAWNEYLEVPDSRVYDPINKVRERAGIPSVKESWQNYSNQPNKIENKVGMREIIHHEYNVELAFERHRYWNLRRWMTAHVEMNTKQYCWNILGDNFNSFYNNGDGPNFERNKYKFIAPRDYFAPIKSEQILISGMRQNPQW